jgi:hypothetical protein
MRLPRQFPMVSVVDKSVHSVDIYDILTMSIFIGCMIYLLL